MHTLSISPLRRCQHPAGSGKALNPCDGRVGMTLACVYRAGSFKAVGRGGSMNNIFYIIGVVVVIMVVLGYLGLR